MLVQTIEEVSVDGGRVDSFTDTRQVVQSLPSVLVEPLLQVQDQVGDILAVVVQDVIETNAGDDLEELFSQLQHFSLEVVLTETLAQIEYIFGDGGLLEVFPLGSPFELEQKSGQYFESVNDSLDVASDQAPGQFVESESQKGLFLDITSGHLHELKQLGINLEHILLIAEIAQALVDNFLHEEEDANFYDFHTLIK